MRAVHTKFDRPAIIQDDWADRLILPAERTALAAAIPGGASVSTDPDRILHAAWKNTSVYGGVILRTRYTEDRVAAAAARGVTQYVIIGAGFDSYALRQPLAGAAMRVYEVDHNASQQLKRQRIEQSGVHIPSMLRFVPADLSREDLGEALRRSDFQFDQPAILSWLGVTVYLTREANFATLRSIARFAASGSELIFTYIEDRALHSTSPAMLAARAVLARVGEPWLSGFDPAALPAELSAIGLHLEEDLSGADKYARYCSQRTDGFTAGTVGHIAAVRVE